MHPTIGTIVKEVLQTLYSFMNRHLLGPRRRSSISFRIWMRALKITIGSGRGGKMEKREENIQLSFMILISFGWFQTQIALCGHPEPPINLAKTGMPHYHVSLLGESSAIKIQEKSSMFSTPILITKEAKLG